MRGSLLALVFAIASSACAGTQTDFKPYSATSVKPPVALRAVFAYPGDVSVLREAGGILVGAIAVSGNGFASRDDVRERALEEAASLGGTHVFIASEEANTHWAKVSRDRAVTKVSGDTATTTYEPGTSVPVSTHSGSYVVVRVPPEHWNELPRELRPEPRDADVAALVRTSRRDVSARADVSVTRPTDADSRPKGWWCVVTSETPAASFCERTLELCKSTRADLKTKGILADECFSSTTAVCFGAYHGPSKRSLQVCGLSYEECETRRGEYNQSAEWTLEGGDCAEGP